MSSSTEEATVSQISRPRVGKADSPIEYELEDAFTRMVHEGTQRLQRSWHGVSVTGFFGGTEVAMAILAYLSVLHQTHNVLLAGVAFSIGFLALLLGRSELFTEGFLVPVAAVAAKRATLAQLVKLWAGTMAANLVGGWLLMWLIMVAFPNLHTQAVETAGRFATAPLSAQSFALAILAGMAITLMTRMQNGTDSVFGKIAAAAAGAFLLAGLQLFHSILDSLLIFGALVTNKAPFGYLDWMYWFSYTVVGNMIGGLVLISLLRMLRSKDRLLIERRNAEADLT